MMLRSRGMDSSYLNVFFTFWAEKMGVSNSSSMFFAWANEASPRRRHVSSPRRLALRLGKGVRPGEPWCRLLYGTSPSRRAILRLSEPKEFCYRLLGDYMWLVSWPDL